MVCFYSSVSVVNMAYIKDNSITFFLRPTLLEREPKICIFIKSGQKWSSKLHHNERFQKFD